MTLITSPEAVEEFLDVSNRPAFRNLLDPTDAAEVANLLRRVTLFKPTHIEPICRDPNDDFLLALAWTAQADVLVTRDEDLLALKNHGRTEIIPVSGLFTRLGPSNETAES